MYLIDNIFNIYHNLYIINNYNVYLLQDHINIYYMKSYYGFIVHFYQGCGISSILMGFIVGFGIICLCRIIELNGIIYDLLNYDSVYTQSYYLTYFNEFSFIHYFWQFQHIPSNFYLKNHRQTIPSDDHHSSTLTYYIHYNLFFIIVYHNMHNMEMYLLVIFDVIRQ